MTDAVYERFARNRELFRLLQIYGPQPRKWIRDQLGLSYTSRVESVLRSCDHHGFLLYEEDDGRVGAWGVVDGR